MQTYKGLVPYNVFDVVVVGWVLCLVIFGHCILFIVVIIFILFVVQAMIRKLKGDVGH